MLNNKESYHNCCWCMWYDKGVCVNERVLNIDKDVEIYPFCNDGTLSEAIKESFGDTEFKQLKQALFETKLSKKKQQEILDVFQEELEEAIISWTESIDSNVSSALENYDFECEVEIVDPTEFYCKYYQ